jgi:hypothetical protein
MLFKKAIVFWNDGCKRLIHPNRRLSSDATSYMRFTSIERYAEAHQLAVIMPNADHSGYANMAFGHNYYD